MNSTRILLVAATAAVLAGGFTAASARDVGAATAINRGHVSGHAYQNGGIGREQVAQMRRHMQPYDLRIAFSEGPHNAYVADVKLHVTDATGKQVFGLKDAGPLTDVSLPAGRYHVAADFGGVRRTASVDVKPEHPTDLYLHWGRNAA